MKLLICGDSFAANWQLKYQGTGWPNMLADVCDVTNVAQAGCGEYKIYQQIKNQNLSKYDKIIISHTSPYRIHTLNNPIHLGDALHHSSDFIYEDAKANGLDDITNFFEKYFDLEYGEFVHKLICEQIDNLTKSLPVIHITHFNWKNLYQFPQLLNFCNLRKNHSGLINHYSDSGNKLVYNKLYERIFS